MTSGYDSDDYELLPHEEIEHLREEVNHLRKNPFKDRAEPVDLQSSIDKLTNAVEHLTKILVSANDEMLEDFKKTSIQENFNIISSQNEKIAEGILTVAQLVQAPSTPASTTAVQEDSEQVQQPIVPAEVPVQAPVDPLPQVVPVVSPAVPIPSAPPVPVQAALVQAPGMPMPPPQANVVPPVPGGMPMPPGGMNLPPPPQKKSPFGFLKK